MLFVATESLGDFRYGSSQPKVLATSATVGGNLKVMLTPDWRRPDSMAPGTWRYVHSAPIADGYDAFVAGTPLCDLDRQLVTDWLPTIGDGSLRIADLGCGTGRTIQTLAELGHRVVAVDRSAAMLRHVSNRRLPGVQTVLADLTDLGGLADDCVDGVTCLLSTIGMIRGGGPRAEVLGHAARITRPGGRLLIHAHHRWAAMAEPGGWRRLAGQWVRTIVRSEDFGDSTYAYRGLPDMFLHRFGRRELTRLVGQNGWRVDEVLRVAADGSRIVEGGLAGGFFVVATRC